MVENGDFSPYRVTENAETAPGCFVTGSAKGPFIDTGIYIRKERFGQLILSADFIHQAAHQLGLFAETEDKIQKAYDIGFAEGVKEELSGSLDRAVDSMGLVVDVLRSIRDAGSDPVEAPEPEEQLEPAEVDAGESTPARSKRAPRQSVRAAVDEGPVVVPAGASDVDPFRV